MVDLIRGGKKHRKYVSRIVLEAFRGPCPKGMEACHDPDPDVNNNRLENLRWDTHLENMNDIRKSGKRMGRKPLSDDERRDKPLRIRLTDAEREVIDDAAESAGDNSTSRWARDALLKIAERELRRKKR